MKRVAYPALLATCVALLTALVPERTSASDKLNFSGKYVFEEGKNASNGAPTTLQIVQNDDRIEITRVKLGKETVSHCPLNGSDGDYKSPYGGLGKCKAQLKPKYLILESVFAGSRCRVRRKEKWQLSADAKTLTIKSEEDIPGCSAFFVSGGVASSTLSETVKYRRTSP